MAVISVVGKRVVVVMVNIAKKSRLRLIAGYFGLIFSLLT